MDLDWIWKGAAIVLVGTFLLRMSGRKTISQMTLAETVLMISIGTLLVQPVANKNIWVAFAIGAIFVLTLLIMEYVQLKSDGIEKIITGKSKTLIANGSLKEKNMAKLRITVDQLEMNLRQNNVSKIEDVEWATLEPNGKLGFMLKQEAQPVTKKEFQQLQQAVNEQLSAQSQLQKVTQQLNEIQKQLNEPNIFKEVEDKGHQYPPSDHLQ